MMERKGMREKPGEGKRGREDYKIRCIAMENVKGSKQVFI